MLLFCTKQIGNMLKRVLPVLLSFFLFSAGKAQMNNATAFYKAGMAYKKNNQYSEALTAFSQATSLNKKMDSAYFEMANIYSGSGNTEMALSNYKKTLALNPRFFEAIVALGKTYRDLKQDLDSALYFYHAALKLDNTTKELHYALAWTYNARKEYDKAIPYAIRSLEIDNTYKPAYGELGHAYRASGKFAECIEQLKKNIAVSAVDVAYLYSGYAYTELKNKEGAMEMYEGLKKINEKMAAALKKKIDTLQ